MNTNLLKFTISLDGHAGVKDENNEFDFKQLVLIAEFKLAGVNVVDAKCGNSMAEDNETDVDSQPPPC